MTNQKTLAERIRELGDANKYEEQGRVFLEETGTTMEVVEAVPQREPSWKAEQRDIRPIHYSVTLRNARHSYTFDFWGSIHDAEMVELAKTANRDSAKFFKLSDFLKKETGRAPMRFDALGRTIIEKTREAVKPDAYTILACLKDSAGDSFEDFCASYGYDTDSRTAEKIYHAIMEQERNVYKLFTHEEVEALAEIA